MKVFNGLVLFALTASFGAVGAISPTSASSPSSSMVAGVCSPSFLAEKSAVSSSESQENLESISSILLDDFSINPLTYYNDYPYSVGSLLSNDKASLYTFVFVPSRDNDILKIDSLYYVDNLEQDSNGVYTDESGDYLDFQKTCSVSLLSDSYENANGYFRCYKVNDVLPSDFNSTWRFKIESINFDDSGMDKDTIAVYRNFEPSESCYNFENSEMSISHNNLLEVENHFDSEQFSVYNGDTAPGIVEENAYSCFSFSSDVSKLGDLTKLEIDYDRTLIKTAVMDFGQDATNSPASQFVRLFETYEFGAGGFKEISEQSTEQGHKQIVDGSNSVTFYTYGWYSQYSHEFPLIVKTSEQTGLSDDAYKYDYLCFYDTTFFHTGLVGGFDWHITVNDDFSNVDKTAFEGFPDDEHIGIEKSENISYLRFWFNLGGTVTEYKAIDNHVKDTNPPEPVTKDDSIPAWVWLLISALAVGGGLLVTFDFVKGKAK